MKLQNQMALLIEKGFHFSLFLFALSLPISLAVTNLSLLLCLACCSVFLITRQTQWLWTKTFILLFLFFFWAALTQWFQEGVFKFSYLKSFGKIWNFLPCFIFPFGPCISREKIEKILMAAMTATCAVIFLGAIQYWTEIHYFFEGFFNKGLLVKDHRLYGFQSYPLHSAGLYTVLYLFSLSQTLFQPKRNFWILSACLLGLGVFLTGSRSYYLALAAGTFILLAIRGWRTFFIGSAALALFTIFLFYNAPYVKERILSINAHHTDDSGRERIFLWKSALLMIQSHPWAGVGYKKWGENIHKYYNYFPEWKITRAATAHAHNSFLTVGAETGLIGLFVFLGFWMSLLNEEIMFLKSADRNSFTTAFTLGTVASLAALFIAGLFEHNLLTATVVLAFAFLTALSKCARKQSA